MTVSILVVDDEPLARRKLAALINDVPWAKQVGEAHDGTAVVEAAARLRPDIVLLDVQMPELTGVEVVERLRRVNPVPAVIFTTAYDRYAVTAFELEAVDYLLKPFGAKRFLAALERARIAVEARATTSVLDRAWTVLGTPSSPVSLERIFVRDGNAVVPIALAAIERIEAQDDYVHDPCPGTASPSKLACRRSRGKAAESAFPPCPPLTYRQSRLRRAYGFTRRLAPRSEDERRGTDSREPGAVAGDTQACSLGWRCCAQGRKHRDTHEARDSEVLLQELLTVISTQENAGPPRQ
jgi:DNA-binding LytR/AlgR family response regulator